MSDCGGRNTLKDIIERGFGRRKIKNSKNECKDRVLIQVPGAWVGCKRHTTDRILVTGLNLILVLKDIRLSPNSGHVCLCIKPWESSVIYVNDSTPVDHYNSHCVYYCGSMYV